MLLFQQHSYTKKWELLINTSMIARSIEMVPIDKILIEVNLIVWWIINGWCKEHWPLKLEKRAFLQKWMKVCNDLHYP